MLSSSSTPFFRSSFLFSLWFVVIYFTLLQLYTFFDPIFIKRKHHDFLYSKHTYTHTHSHCILSVSAEEVYLNFCKKALSTTASVAQNYRYVSKDTWNHIQPNTLILMRLKFVMLNTKESNPFPSIMSHIHWRSRGGRRRWLGYCNRRPVDGVNSRRCKLMMNCDFSPGKSLVALPNWSGRNAIDVPTSWLSGYHQHQPPPPSLLLFLCVLSRRWLTLLPHLIQNNKFDFDANNKVISTISSSSAPLLFCLEFRPLNQFLSFLLPRL